MQVQENVSLKPYNTFGISVLARHFVSLTSVAHLKVLLGNEKYPNPLIIGGGSNMLLTQDIDRLVIHVNFKGIEVIDASYSDTEVLLKVAGGENWHDFVRYCVSHNLGGVENLSLIPGSVGASPIQNIGAYGVELRDVFYECSALHRITCKERVFNLEDCAFGYRNSVFKNELKDQYVVTSVTFRLTKNDHKIRTAYGAIGDVLSRKQIVSPTIEQVSEAVIAIRQSKLPDPKIIGNSGSFFKNPVITQERFTALSRSNLEMPHYPVGDDMVKVPAGWLIEQAGFKGKRFGDAGVHDKQALVLVNHGDATGQELWEVATKIQAEVKEKFGIEIIPEVNIL